MGQVLKIISYSIFGEELIYHATEDFSKDDASRSYPIVIEKFGNSYQENRLKLIDDIKDEVSNELIVLCPRWRHTNIFINNIIIIFDALLKLMQNDIYNIKPWIKYTILSRIPIFKKRLKKIHLHHFIYS